MKFFCHRESIRHWQSDRLQYVQKDIHYLIVFRMTSDAVNDRKGEFSFRQIFSKSFILLELKYKMAFCHTIHSSWHKVYFSINSQTNSTHSFKDLFLHWLDGGSINCQSQLLSVSMATVLQKYSASEHYMGTGPSRGNGLGVNWKKMTDWLANEGQQQ